MNQNEYIKLSLELHLFFDRIMKEHSLFLEAAFVEKDADLKKIANNFQKAFSNLLKEVINMADGNISEEFVLSNEMVTKNTLSAENQTNDLLGTQIETSITIREMNLRSGNIIDNRFINHIHNINTKTLSLVQELINFKNSILNKVLACKMYTTNYPLLISHIMNEAKMYYSLLIKLESGEPFTEDYLYEQELFWNNIMKEHAEFIRGLLDPSEQDLILTADQYADEYEMIIKNYSNNPVYLTDVSLNETLKFRDFKIASEEGILNCKIKSIIIPLLADHVLREANHFIRILREN